MQKEQTQTNKITNNPGLGVATSDIALLNEIEKKLVQIWQEMLGIESFKKNDNFFELGGHSIIAMKGLTRIKEKFKIEITFKDFMTSPTIATQGEIIKARIKSKNDISQIKGRTEVEMSYDDYINISKIKTQREFIKASTKKIGTHRLSKDTANSENLTRFPLTASQKRLWYLCKLNNSSPAYNIPITIKLTGNLDINILHKTIKLIFKRQNIVFANFYSEEGEPYISINKNQNLIINEHNLEKLPEKELKNKYNEIISSDSRLAFNLEKGLLFRLHLLKTGRSEWLFHVTIHHLVFDGISWGIFFNEFNDIYKRLIKNEEVDLESIDYHQYDYAKWLENNPSEEDSDSVEFWKKYLDGIPDYTKFPLDRSRKTIPSGKGARLEIKIPTEITQNIRAYSINQNTTIFITMLAAFSLLIKRFSGEDDFCIGTPIANRPHVLLENIFGLFADTFPLRFKFEEINTFENLLSYVKSAMLNVFENRDVEFDKILETINPKRSVLYNSIFQIAFVWPSELSATIKTEQLTGERFHIKDGVTPFDITFYMWENKGEIEGEIEYNIDLFNESTIISLKESYVKLLKSIQDNLKENINNLNIVNENQFIKLIEFNKTRTKYPQESVISLLKKTVNKNPKKPALSCGGEKISYTELDKRSNQLALELTLKGVKEGEPVGIFMEKSNELIISIVAILKVKCHYLPLDIEYPKQRIIDTIEDAGCSYIVTSKDLESSITGSFKHIVINDSVWKYKALEFSTFSSKEDVAYIMYTSGTTGSPKGSLIKHKSIVRLVRNTNYINFKENDNILLTGAIGFDATTFEIWGSLLNGCTLFIVDKEVLLDPQKLEKEINKNKITILWLTSSLFTQISELNINVFANVRCLLVGGDVLSVESVNKVRNMFPNLTIINGYGPTENTTFSTCHIIKNDYEDNIPIGKPISNSTAYVFNEYLKLQPIGSFGELYVGGDGLSAGYLNRPKLNFEKFISNPLNPSERLFKTGDKARWLSDGVLEYNGRIDSQLKIRGFRVEPLEIEAQMNKIPGIIETVIKPIERINGNVELYAFVNIKENSTITRETIISYLRKSLPMYMIPVKYDLRIGFPKTINGKINRKALKFKSEIFELKENTNESKMNDIEQRVYAIFSDAVKHENFNRESNFFEIGGNSLLSIKVILQLEKYFNITLKIRDFIADLNSVSKISELILARIDENKQVTLKSQKSNEMFDHLYCIRRPNGNDIPIFSIYCDQLFTEKDTLKARAIYDFTWPGSDGRAFTESSVEEVAQNYLVELQRINPTGPYYLIGFSFGGLVAYDIALKLQKRGYRIPVLILIDSANPRFWKSLNIGQKLRKKIKKNGFIKSFTVRLFNVAKYQTKTLLKKIEIYIYFKLNKKLSVHTRQVMISNEVIKLALKYQPEFYNGEIYIFKSKDNPIEDQYLGWHSKVSNIKLFELEGHHMEAMSKSDNKNSIIRELESLIKEAEEN